MLDRTVEIRIGSRVTDTGRLTYVEQRAFVAVALGVFFARLFDMSIDVIGTDLPGYARGPVKKALRFYRERARFSWRDF